LQVMTAKDQLIQELPQLTEDLAAQILTFLRSAQATQVLPRPYGLCAGEFTLPDDFDAPLPEDILQAFENPA
jgi:ubiquitin